MAESNMVIDPTIQTAATASKTNPAALSGLELLGRLQSGSIVDLLLDAKCGLLSNIGCLCDPVIREAAEIIGRRFGDETSSLLYRSVCGCSYSPPEASVVAVPASGIVPASYNPTVTPGTPKPAAGVTPQPVEPAVSCSPALPPKGSYSALK